MPEFNPFQSIDEQSLVPPKCEGCGLQCELASELGRLMLVKKIIEMHGTSIMSEQFEEFVDANVPIDLADKLKSHSRQQAGEDLELVDTEIDSMQTEMKGLEDSCSGPFKMRATKDGITYTVSVCTSPNIYEAFSPQAAHVPTHIDTKFVG